MIYFDHAATTPCSKEVIDAMLPYFSKDWGNPSSIYTIGREAEDAVRGARDKIADILGAERNEIIFTSGATESNNLAIKGACENAAKTLGTPPHVITTQIEHHSVLDTFKYLEKNLGLDVTYLEVSKEGIVDTSLLEKSIKKNTALVSVMAGNNEMGALQSIKEVGKIIRAVNDKRKKEKNILPVIFHTDAVQAFAFLPTKVNELGVDMLSLTAHKFYGPKGVGILYVRSGVNIDPQQHGGAQERRRRAGTENVPYIIGMSKAMERADKNRNKYYRDTLELTNYLIKRVVGEIPKTTLLGPKNPNHRLPHIANFVFKGVEGESILINLDIKNIACSSGSACTSGSLEPSHVTRAMGFSDIDAHGAIRFSLGCLNKKEDIDSLMVVLPEIIKKLRVMSPI